MTRFRVTIEDLDAPPGDRKVTQVEGSGCIVAIQPAGNLVATPTVSVWRGSPVTLMKCLGGLLSATKSVLGPAGLPAATAMSAAFGDTKIHDQKEAS